MKIAIIGEAWGEHEERNLAPFVGPSGHELTKMLSEAGIHRADCFLTNVFNLRPKPTNDIENLCVSKTDPHAASGLPPLKTGKYIRSEYLPHVVRLLQELRDVRPNLCIALGNTAAWALLHNSGIRKIRGAITESVALRGFKVLPTYHPAAILREWSLRHVTVMDFMKARLESEFPEIRRPERTVYIEPNLTDMEWFYDQHIASSDRLSIDIETRGNQITCFGVATSSSVAIVVPFTDDRKPQNSYWPDLGSELSAWAWVRKVCGMPTRKVFQNGLYDIHFLWRSYHIPVANCEDDTMLLHHSLMPESEKGLGFLGSVYTNEASWKLMRARGKTTIKRDE